MFMLLEINSVFYWSLGNDYRSGCKTIGESWKVEIMKPLYLMGFVNARNEWKMHDQPQLKPIIW